jgi:hypothetical protein
VFERHGSCQPKTQIARHGGHGRHDLERVINRNLRRLPYRGVATGMMMTVAAAISRCHCEE